MGNISKDTLRALPLQIQDFVNDVLLTAQEQGVRVVLSDDRSVALSEDVQSNGFFQDGDEPTLACACGQDPNKWLLILLHESCHMDQWIEQSPFWIGNKLEDGGEPMDLVFDWCNGNIELTDDQIQYGIKVGRNVELDCEKRATQKIIDFGLEDIISVSEYIQKSNAYVAFYTIIGKTRRWYTVGMEPYNVESVWRSMPTEFMEDYDNLPPHLYSLLAALVGVV